LWIAGIGKIRNEKLGIFTTKRHEKDTKIRKKRKTTEGNGVIHGVSRREELGVLVRRDIALLPFPDRVEL